MKVLAIDTETSWKNCCNIPFIGTTCDDKLRTKLYDLRNKKGVTSLRRASSDQNVLKIFHNAPYDLTCLENIGISVAPPFEDTFIMSQILNENFESKKLKSLAKLYLNELCNEEKELSKVKRVLKSEAKKAGKIFSYEDLPAKILEPYALKDPFYTYKLWKFFNKTIEKFRDIYNLELSIIPVIVEMQRYGMEIDRKFVKKMYKQYYEEMIVVYAKMEKELKRLDLTFSKIKKYKREPRKPEKWDKIVEKNGAWFATKYEPYKPKSTKQFRKVIEKLGIEIQSKTKGGDIATDSVALQPHKDVPFIKLHLRYSFLQKQTGTYYGPLYEWYTSKKNNRAHFSLYQSSTKSGRFSAELIQTIPRKDEDKAEENVRLIRNAFVPKKGYSIVAIDYDQIEMRLFAHFANCGPLIKGILAGMDPHDSTTVTLFGEEATSLQKSISILKKKLDGITNSKIRHKVEKKITEYKNKFKALRRIAKTINFGIIYGMGQNKLARSLGLSTYEASAILKKYYKAYPVKEYMSAVTRQLHKTGSVTVLAESKLMKLYREYRVPQELAYKSANIIIQGIAAYTMKAGMRRVWEYIKKKGLDVRLIMTIHDELIFEVSNKYKDKEMLSVIKQLKDCMEDHYTFKVPIIASAKMSSVSWGDCKDVKLAA